MGAINERIALCIEESGLTKTAFAERINLSQPHISRLAKDSVPSDRTISDICREFGVNEEWLRTGDGPMKQQLSGDEEFTKAMTHVQVSGDERIKKAVTEALKLYWGLTDEQKKVVWDFIDRIAENEKGQA